MQRYGSMPMPAPQAIPNMNNQSYGSSMYNPLPPILPMEVKMDREMNVLIDNLKNTIKDAPDNELENLLSNEDSMITLIEDSQQMRELKSKRNDICQSNKDQAIFNLSLQPELENMKEKLSEALLFQSSKKEEYDILKSKLESLAGNFSLDTTLALLQASASEKDSNTEKISDQLLKDEIQVDEFVEKYIPERTVYHLRKIKADKMAEIVQNGQQIQQPAPVYYGTGYGHY